MSRLSPADRAIYRALADALVPAFGALPAASRVGVADDGVDRVLGWRPDIAGDLLRAVAKSRSLPPDDALAALERDDPEALKALRLAVLGAYYLDRGVMEVLGYGGQPSRPVQDGETPDFLNSPLLAPVIARGAIWRDPGA
jgi:hypothetical protein